MTPQTSPGQYPGTLSAPPTNAPSTADPRKSSPGQEKSFGIPVPTSGSTGHLYPPSTSKNPAAAVPVYYALAALSPLKAHTAMLFPRHCTPAACSATPNLPAHTSWQGIPAASRTEQSALHLQFSGIPDSSQAASPITVITNCRIIRSLHLRHSGISH